MEMEKTIASTDKAEKRSHTIGLSLQECHVS